MLTDLSAASIFATRDWLEPKRSATWDWVKPKRSRQRRRPAANASLVSLSAPIEKRYDPDELIVMVQAGRPPSGEIHPRFDRLSRWDPE